MNYPYRECRCGNQIHVGGRSVCDSCRDGISGGALDDVNIRDYFAAKAMQGQLAAARPNQPESITTLARVSFDIADAMIKARNV